MGSLDRNVKEKQLEKAVASFDAYKATLAEKGLDEKASLKDPTFKALKAKVKKARSRIRAIDDAVAHVEKMRADAVKAKADKAAKAEKAKAKAKAAKGKQPKGDKKAAKPAKKKK